MTAEEYTRYLDKLRLRPKKGLAATIEKLQRARAAGKDCGCGKKKPA